ncbi:hypothetical protein AC579_5708 [Pseudocercospora musae]|uniref:SnoaL-like domain-containing protein n=1 Tax=Pseudocercospora musae TaxID=113226 RepID=A0A139IRU6_9PEZI|nr:hypothetical protein AC579_5708 [Pseudocercospora musae]
MIIMILKPIVNPMKPIMTNVVITSLLLLAPLSWAVLAAPPKKPEPCICNPHTTTTTTEFRAQAFAKAFIYEQDISEAFKYIAQDYINHNPAAQNGFDSAWDILSPIWAEQNITAQRTAFEYPQSWLGYHNVEFGDVVDRYRWDGGCIVEHVSVT